MDGSCAHFKFMQAERLNVVNLTSDCYLSSEMSGSTIIADITSGSFSLYLPQPESGLNFRIIIKASTTTLTYTLNIIGTSDDKTQDSIINFVGSSTEKLDDNNLPTSTNSSFKSLNILQGEGISKLYFGSPYHLQTPTSNATTNNHMDGSVNNFYNSTGDFVELICDGTDWYAHGMTKNMSVYKIIGSNIVYTY